MYILDEIFYYKSDIEGVIYALNCFNGSMLQLDEETYLKLRNKSIEEFATGELATLKEKQFLFESKSEFENIISSEEKEKRSVNIIPTFNCNFNCEYCFQSKNTEIINYKFAYKYIEKLIQSSENFSINIMGGEVFQEKFLYETIEFLKFMQNKNIEYKIITNGYDLELFLPYLKGCEDIQITVDGSEENHNKKRAHIDGGKTYKKIMGNIKRAIEDGYNVTVRVNIDSENYKEVGNLKEQFSDFLNNENFDIYIYPLQDGGEEFENKIEDETKILEEFLRKKAYKDIGSNFHGQSMLNALLLGKEFDPITKRCAAYSNGIVVTGENKFSKCWFGAEKDDFKVSEEEFSKIDKEWKEKNVYSNRHCSECIYKFLCGGGCVSNKFSRGKEVKELRNCANYRKVLSLIIEEYIDEKL